MSSCKYNGGSTKGPHFSFESAAKILLKITLFQLLNSCNTWQTLSSESLTGSKNRVFIPRLPPLRYGNKEVPFCSSPKIGMLMTIRVGGGRFSICLAYILLDGFDRRGIWIGISPHRLLLTFLTFLSLLTIPK